MSLLFLFLSHDVDVTKKVFLSTVNFSDFIVERFFSRGSCEPLQLFYLRLFLTVLIPKNMIKVLEQKSKENSFQFVKLHGGFLGLK